MQRQRKIEYKSTYNSDHKVYLKSKHGKLKIETKLKVKKYQILYVDQSFIPREDMINKTQLNVLVHLAD